MDAHQSRHVSSTALPTSPCYMWRQHLQNAAFLFPPGKSDCGDCHIYLTYRHEDRQTASFFKML